MDGDTWRHRAGLYFGELAEIASAAGKVVLMDVKAGQPGPDIPPPLPVFKRHDSRLPQCE
jgi:hypothetical protein